MKETLNRFATGHLFDACSAMLEQLHIDFAPQTREPMSLPDLYVGAASAQMPASLSNVVEKLSSTYFIGAISQDSLNGHDEAYDLAAADRYDSMLVFAVDAKPDVHFLRSELATLTRGFNRIARAMPVILFVRSGTTLTLSTCERSDYKQSWRDGERLGRVSILRDVNCLAPHRGHIDILLSLGDKRYDSFEELYRHWLTVFSSELLTKKFYTELSEWYAWVIGSGKVRFPNDITTTDDDAKYNHEAVIRLITRLIFVWFLKQKHLVPNEFFDEPFIREHFIDNFDPHSTDSLLYDPERSKYYRLILQNLFFAMLNRPIREEDKNSLDNRRFIRDSFQGKNPDYGINNLMRYRKEFRPGGAEKLLQLANSCVPFLNGGLFECLDDKGSKCYYDGFSEYSNSLAQLSFPDYFFFGSDVGADVDLSGWYGEESKGKKGSKYAHVRVRGIIDILKSYNFTVEENTPLDQEVSLDPELLGKVFENLLASYNPETNTTARKQTGSFYTPREVVQFMVDESLLAYLGKSCPNIDKERLRVLFDYATDACDFSADERNSIITAIYNCKILDPGCGSGAFPMGILQQMVHALRKLDPTNKLWYEFILELSLRKDREAYKVENEAERKRLRDDIEQAFNRNVNDPDYARKLYLIENCIYGTDIQPIAIQISKLRIFISLIAEQRPTADAANNFGIRPLPNLETKFVAANSLMSAAIRHLSVDWTYDEKLIEIKEELLSLRNRHLFAKSRREKDKIEDADAALRQRILRYIVDNTTSPDFQKIATWEAEIARLTEDAKQYEAEVWVDGTRPVEVDLFGVVQYGNTLFREDINKAKRDSIKSKIKAIEQDIKKEKAKTGIVGFEAAVKQLAEWKPFDHNAVSPFFDPDWMFGVQSGFDIVIGNPPYFQLQNNKGELTKLYKPCGYKTFASTGDIYCLFYERGWQLLRKGGHLCFITSNKWMRAGYGEKTREFFVKHTNPIMLVDFGGVSIFESATVDTNVLLFAKEDNQFSTLCAVTNKQNKDSVKNLSVFLRQTATTISFRNSDNWVVLSPIELQIKQKIEAVGIPLKDWNINIYRGILTGYNDAFIISSDKRNEILANCQSADERARTEELIRPILRGRDIKRYSYDWAGLYLIATFPSRHYDIEQYPAVKAYLLSFGIERLEQTGKTYIINGEKVTARKKTNNKWFETQDSISYWDIFV